MFVQENLTRQAPLSRSPNTQRAFLNVLNLPKYRPAIQRFGLLQWWRHVCADVQLDDGGVVGGEDVGAG
jgi:hypothetical protein